MSQAHVSAEELAQGTVLACRIMPHSDLCLQVVGKMKKSVCGRATSSTEEGDSETAPARH